MAHPIRRNRPVWGGFFVSSRILPFLGDFPAFLGLGGTSYCPARKSVLNRKFGRNNFFRKNLQKLSTFFW